MTKTFTFCNIYCILFVLERKKADDRHNNGQQFRLCHRERQNMRSATVTEFQLSDFFRRKNRFAFQVTLPQYCLF